MDVAKIRLSAKEMRLAKSEEFILTKNAILEKTKQLLGSLKPEYDTVFGNWQFNVELSSAKLSRGENYQGLPWVILDHPRYFKGNDILAIRTMFWWGNFFSITLHLSGKPKKDAEEKVMVSFRKLKKRGFLVCVNDDQWQHDMGKRNYRSLKKMKRKEFEEIISGKDFIKLVNKVSLKKWEKALLMLVNYFGELIILARPLEH